MTQQSLFRTQCSREFARELSFSDRAEYFCRTTPHREEPYSRRNWGGPLHSLCSYQGKLKPSIAHFLVDWFTEPGDVVLDPLSGVGTIPLEARRLGRVGVANDLSPLAYTVSAAKLEPVSFGRVEHRLLALAKQLQRPVTLDNLSRDTNIDWGLNGRIRDYFHDDTLREILIARRYLLGLGADRTPEDELLCASIMHILHGNRPYALSRRSHPVTPLAPSGPFEYRPLLPGLNARIERLLPDLLDLAEFAPNGRAYCLDYRDLRIEHVDVVITSPPFAKSLRFWSSNWMRLWFSGWEPQDFKRNPVHYLETQQRSGYEPYRELIQTVAASMHSGAKLIMHLGETPKENMAELIEPLLAPEFATSYVGREGVSDTESHGLTDKGATIAHWYLFAERA